MAGISAVFIGCAIGYFAWGVPVFIALSPLWGAVIATLCNAVFAANK